MAIIRGVLEMLQTADGNEPKSFNDFTRISIKGKRLSSATVSKRIDELVGSRVLKEVIIKSKTGRRVIAYKTTEKGKRVVELAKELQEALSGSKTK
jgi:predicted transcriptional regulator